ncbi:hypothetical protein COOONC_22370 [Cooperia oncophora]
MLISDTRRRGISSIEFSVGFLSLLLSVLFIIYGYSLKSHTRSQSVTISSQEFENVLAHHSAAPRSCCFQNASTTTSRIISSIAIFVSSSW